MPAEGTKAIRESEKALGKRIQEVDALERVAQDRVSLISGELKDLKRTRNQLRAVYDVVHYTPGTAYDRLNDAQCEVILGQMQDHLLDTRLIPGLLLGSAEQQKVDLGQAGIVAAMAASASTTSAVTLSTIGPFCEGGPNVDAILKKYGVQDNTETDLEFIKEQLKMLDEATYSSFCDIVDAYYTAKSDNSKAMPLIGLRSLLIYGFIENQNLKLERLDRYKQFMAGNGQITSDVTDAAIRLNELHKRLSNQDKSGPSPKMGVGMTSRATENFFRQCIRDIAYALRIRKNNTS